MFESCYVRYTALTVLPLADNYDIKVVARQIVPDSKLKPLNNNLNGEDGVTKDNLTLKNTIIKVNRNKKKKHSGAKQCQPPCCSTVILSVVEYKW